MPDYCGFENLYFFIVLLMSVGWRGSKNAGRHSRMTLISISSSTSKSTSTSTFPLSCYNHLLASATLLQVEYRVAFDYCTANTEAWGKV
jgi:hypothetical protein